MSFAKPLRIPLLIFAVFALSAFASPIATHSPWASSAPNGCALIAKYPYPDCYADCTGGQTSCSEVYFDKLDNGAMKYYCDNSCGQQFCRSEITLPPSGPPTMDCGKVDCSQDCGFVWIDGGWTCGCDD